MGATRPKLWAGGHVTVYVEAWDQEESVARPTVRPHAAWITEPTNVILTIMKPNDAPNLVLTLEDEEIVEIRDGEWRARWLADDGAGDYWCDWEIHTADGYIAPAPIKATVKPRPT